jgi:hypothetical protein
LFEASELQQKSSWVSRRRQDYEHYTSVHPE